MPVISADSLQLSAVKETTPGVTPQTPAFDVWRTTGESLIFAPQVSESATIGGSGRSKSPSNVTGMQVNGDINFELAKFPALEAAIGGVLAAHWGECPLTGAAGGAIDSTARITVGKKLETFTIEKRFPNSAFVRGTVPTLAVGPTGAQTVTLTFTLGAPGTGTGMVVGDIQVAGAASNHFTVPISVGQDQDAVATAVATEIDKIAGVTATAAANVVTVDSGTGDTIAVANVRAGQDEYYYQRFKGASYSALSIAAAPNSTVTGSVSIVGGTPELDTLPITGATYNQAGSNPVFTAPKVMRLDIGAMGISTACWTDLTIEIDSANRGVPCIGSQGDREVVLGTLGVTVSGSVYFANQDILDALLKNQTMGNAVITLGDSGNNVYRFDLFGMKPTGGSLAAGGAGQDLVIPVSFEPTPVKVCEDASNTPWDSGMIISTVDTAPTLP